MTALQQQGAAAKAATYVLATAGTAKKNAALAAIADILTARQEEWLAANAADVAAAKEAGMRPAMLVSWRACGRWPLCQTPSDRSPRWRPGPTV